MEIPDESMVSLRSFRPRQSVGLDAAVSLDPEQEQEGDSEPDTQPGSNQETPEQVVERNGPPPRALLEFRIQQLHNRRFLLLKMQHFRNKTEDSNGGTKEEMTTEDSEELCELEAIQKELEELLLLKEELEKQGKSSKLTDGQLALCPTFYKTETPCGGIYMLPPPQLTQEDVSPEKTVKTGRQKSERPTGPVVAVDSLGHTPAVTQCPSCKEVVFTKTCSKMGDTVWIICCLSSMLGCVAGCCLIPFFMDRLRDVHHQCPQCQAPIHTYQPF